MHPPLFSPPPLRCHYALRCRQLMAFDDAIDGCLFLRPFSLPMPAADDATTLPPLSLMPAAFH